MTAPYFSDNGMPGSPSAISALLAQLTQLTQPPMPPPQAPVASGSPAPAPPGQVTLGGITMPAPQAAPMPQVHAPPQPQSLAQRIGGLLAAPVRGLLGVGDTPTPAGYDGLLTPDEIKSAKPGRLASLIGTPDAPSPTARFQSNLDHIIALKQLAGGISEQQRIKQAIATMPQLPPNATQDQFKLWAQQAYAHAIQNNLPEDIKSKFANIVTEAIKAPKADVTHTLTPGSVLLDDKGKPIFTNPASEKSPVVGSQEWRSSEEFKAQLAAKYRVEPTQIMQGADANGAVHFYRVPKDGGNPVMIPDIVPPGKGAASATMANLPAPMAAKVGQAGEMIKKAADLFPLMEGLSVGLGQSTASDVARGVGALGHIPGAHGVGAALVNRTPTYSQYQTALTPFVLAAAHALSGARINDDQIKQIRASIEVLPGDIGNPTVMAQKRKNLSDLVNSIGGSLPANAIAAQEDQMEPKSLASLKSYGYRGAARAPVAAPSAAPKVATPAKAAPPTDLYSKYGLTPRKP